MARDRASIRLDMWADENWRDLTEGAQHLYMLILSHPTLSYAGVAEWRPGRLAAMTKGKTADKIKQDAAELVGHTLIVVDESTEEVLVRSFIKHDGLMKQPKLVVSMANAFAAVASKTLRMVIAFEVQKLRDREPDLKAWGVKQVQTVLDSTGKPAAELTPGFTPDVTLDFTPGFTPNDGQHLGLPTATATTTATLSKDNEAAKRGSRVPEPFIITDDMRSWAATETPLVDLDKKTLAFVDYWASVPGSKGVKLDWVRTWKNDMRTKQEFAEKDGARKPKARPGWEMRL